MPSITIWNRLEARCRADDFESGLAARVHDPLWLLARQWQVGEFAGCNTGSPIMAQVQSTVAPFERYAVGSAPVAPYDGSAPFEALVEREPVRPANAASDLRQSAEAGLHFLRMLDAAGLSRLRRDYVESYPIRMSTAVDADSIRLSMLVAGRLVDGIGLRAALAQAGTSLPASPALNATDAATVLTIANTWTIWFDSLFDAVAATDGWSPERMEYSFTVNAAGEPNSLTAREYDGGAIDWFTFDQTSTVLAGGSMAAIQSLHNVAVAPVTFKGMPGRRFWEMEDASVDVGALTAGAEDLGRLLLREFALVYGNDWFQIPVALPVGSQVRIDSLAIVDTFGVVSMVPHYAAVDGVAGTWRMFALTPAVTSSSPVSALILPASGVGTLDSIAIEDVLLLRDEPARMAWGVEKTAVGPSGTPLDRGLAWRTAQPAVPAPSADGVQTYRLGSAVPDYWIPFLPVPLDTGPLQMRRGRLPTAAGGPIGRLLGEPGLTIPLEELPQEGARIERVYRYARGLDGSTHLWIGRRRSTGTGEGRSGLRFDFLE